MIEALRIGLAGRASQDQIASALAAQGFAGDERRLAAAAAELSAFIIATPDRIRALTQLIGDPQYGRAVAFGLAQVLVYLVDEHDLYGDAAEGAAGMLDDAYLVHRYLEDICRTYPAARERVESFGSRETGALVARLLPEGIAAALDRTSERLILVGASLFQAANAGNSIRPDAPPPKLRLNALA